MAVRWLQMCILVARVNLTVINALPSAWSSVVVAVVAASTTATAKRDQDDSDDSNELFFFSLVPQNGQDVLFALSFPLFTQRAEYALRITNLKDG